MRYDFIPCLMFLFFFANKGNLLDINFQAIYESNKMTTTENANVFVLSWIGDGATINRVSLLNMLVMCGSNPPAVITILDCTGHMMDGGEKDAVFIMFFFKSKVDELIQERHLLTLSSLMG